MEKKLGVTMFDVHMFILPIGLVKIMDNDKEREKREKKTEARTAANSRWTQRFARLNGNC